MVQIMPYILPLMLGRTFDLHKMKVGVDIFPKETIDNKQVYDMTYTKTYNGLVESARDARDLLDDVGNGNSLKIKAGIVNAGASGKYLSDLVNRRNTVEIVIKVLRETDMEYLPYDSEPNSNWKKYGEALGTHFVRSITYGGDIIVSIRLGTNNTAIKDMIKNSINHRVLDLGAMEESEYQRDILKSVTATSIKIFSSEPLIKLPADVKSLRILHEVTKGKGVPIKVELSPLEELDLTRGDELENRLSSIDLDGFEYKFDNMLETKTAISDWMKNLVKPLTEEQEQKVGDFYNSLVNTLKAFYEAIGKLDTSKGLEQFKRAYDTLDEELEEDYGRYFYKKYLQLREEIDKDKKEESKK